MSIDQRTRQDVRTPSARHPRRSLCSHGFSLGAWLLLMGALAATRLQGYLLFHTLAELVSIVVACGIFMIAWNSREFTGGGHLLLLGVASLSIAGVDLVHTLAYKGMSIFPGDDANLPTQLWIAARYLQSLSLLAMPLVIGRRLRGDLLLGGYAAATVLLFGTIFLWDLFPACYVEGVGLTPFKKGSEYVIVALLLVAMVLFRARRMKMDTGVVGLLSLAIATTIASELCFTAYIGVYDWVNMTGHLLKVLAFGIIYAAIIETSLRQPYRTLFRDLQESEQALRRAHAEEAEARELAEAMAERANDYAARTLKANEELAAANEELQVQTEELAAQQAALADLSEELRQQQARLEAVIRQMPAGVFIAEAPSGEILLGNAELARLFQRPVGLPTTLQEYGEWERLHPDGRPLRAEEVPVVRALRDGVVVAGQEIRIVRPDGSQRTVSASAAPIRDAEGRMVAVVAVNLDITERKRAEESLRFLLQASEVMGSSLEYEATLERIAHLALPALGDYCVIDVVGDDGVPRRVAAAHADASRQALVAELHRYPPRVEWPDGVPEVLRTGQPIYLPEVPRERLEAAAQDEAHLRLLRKLGTESVVMVPLQARGEVLGAISWMFGPSARRHTSEDLALAEEVARRAAGAVDNARLYQRSQEASAAKDHLLAVVSHELRNPLSPILAGVALLRRGNVDPARLDRTLAIIDRNARLQARLVSDLLDISRMARGKIPLQRTPVVVDAMLDAALQAKRAEAEDAGLDLRVDPCAGLWVLGDQDRLQQIILNLLTNAIKFTPAGGAVRISAARYRGEGETGGAGDGGTSQECVRIVVEDTGIGIDPGLLSHLFEVFRQGEVAGQRQQGLGIGLSLVRSLAEMHGGRVWAESEGAGRGSRFTVELPLIPPPDARGGADGVDAIPREIRALLVEDNPDTRAVLQENLEAMGYRVNAVTSAEDALPLLLQEKPDVILSDIGLPGMDGYAFLRRAREAGCDGVPAFALTGLGSAEDVRRAQEAGYAGHFVKPIDVTALDRGIREWLSANRAR